MELLGFEAYITVDGVKVPHYEVKIDERTKAASCWIPSEAGKTFAVNWRPLKPRHFVTCGWVYLDGVSVGAEYARMGRSSFVSQCDVVTSPSTTRPFLFAPVKLTDDDAYLKSENTKDLGSIVLRICAVKMKEVRKARVWTPILVEKVHERTKKATVHQVQFGEERRGAEIYVRESSHIATLATFTFKYRSLERLRADSIAPPDPALQRKRKRTAGDSGVGEHDAEKAELQAQVRVLKAKLAKRSEVNRVKTESCSCRVPATIIDLT
ncbi:hypothetical protein LshimejAT787_0805510 [Lyophyllum shimeji]|uniref:DUF7918 domain-containing protein n=1 Tax=Lyophyllum shimeji TaxID=47721 RepID=A0A9P3PQA7_LYOSH|nr:hypothetical protein LshimejAT787_0805510 [Lyophyllum shimeji]